MFSNRKKIDSMLFETRVSTAMADFRFGEIQLPTETEHKRKPPPKPLPPLRLKDTHSLWYWKAAVPFNLLHKPKDYNVVDTDPARIQKAVDDILEVEARQREEARRTRPRVVMTPAVSIDDIDDPVTREIILNETYITTWAKNNKKAVTPKALVAPMPKKPAPANPLFLERLKPPLVPLEWRMESVKWERNQLRTHLEPDVEFWKTQDTYKTCIGCQQTATVKQARKLKKI